MTEFTPKEISEEELTFDYKNTERIAIIGSYEIYKNNLSHELEIFINDCHPGKLKITKKGLEKLIRVLDF